MADSFDVDGLYVDGNDPDAHALERGLPSVTVDFDVEKYDPEDGEVKYVEGSGLGGWAIFVGLYSDAQIDSLIEGCRTGGHDIGIFNYENKTVSPCYFPCDAKNLRKTFPAPIHLGCPREEKEEKHLWLTCEPTEHLVVVGQEYDPEDKDVKYVEGSSLDGWALFVGLYSNAIALPAAEFSKLNPNSIVSRMR
ncbi:alpha-1A adrenergic receptor [Striga asiatica]|uniref:Alpha-1A adrenergic receptor n=1 Tax=Striga asiatica TaxID=4170 RepID=A0A5A7PSY5_STRAF|nr:alpha-1A adrenergic receptor [Striga asiatica]